MPAPSPPHTVGGIFPELSTQWLSLDWNRLESAKRQMAAQLVSLGAAQVRLQCTLTKVGAPPPIRATIAASGSYWPILKNQLFSLAGAALPWQHRQGDVLFETSKIGLRWTDQGLKACQNGDLNPRCLSRSTLPFPAGAIQLENCEFADGSPFPEGSSQSADFLLEGDVAWSLCGPSTHTVAANGHAVQRESKRSWDPPRSWKQAELDAAILAYRNDPANEFVELCDLVQKGSETAYRKAKAAFGRNAIVRNLGVRSAAMVSKSSAWQTLAAELGLPRGKAKPLPLRRYAVIPLDDALAARANAEDGSILKNLVIVETQREIDELVRQAKLRFRRKDDADQFTAVIDAAKTWLETNKIAPDAALELVEKVIEQTRDGRLQCIRPHP